jgi:hypothetical protein
MYFFFLSKDVANHQLQTLRPFLLKTSGPFELKSFATRPNVPIELTKRWLQAAHDALSAPKPLPPLLRAPYPLPAEYSGLPRNRQVYIAVLRAFTDLVFTPPSSSSSCKLSPPSPPSSSLSSYPETCYLDTSRLAALSVDAADTIALYLYLLLFRQLILADTNLRNTVKPTDADFLKLKSEIRDIGGNRLGYPFSRRNAATTTTTAMKASGGGGGEGYHESKKWCKIKQDIILQVAMRAKEVQNRAQSNASSPTLTSPPPSSSSSSPPSPSLIRNAPDELLLKLAERWSNAHLQPSSALSVMLRDRLRDVVFQAVVSLTFPGRDLQNGRPAAVDFAALAAAATKIDLVLDAESGMEPLTEEIRTLAERISKVALIHLTAFLPLYEQEDFLELGG